MTNIITACFGGTQYANTRPAWLIDHGMVLQIKDIELPETYFVDFANSKAEQATRVLGNADGVVIPDQYFLSNAPQIFAWVYLTTGESGFTTLQIAIPLAQRPDVSTEPPTPQETDLIEQAIAALNNGVERAETAAETAEEAAEHYPRIVDGYWYAWVDGQWANTGVKAEGEDGASAYEQAVAGGYTKSEAQFNAELGSFGELSEQAADSAAAAAQSAEGAADSADTAYQKAGEAASSAQAASQSAQNAAASATAASQSERNAASSASAAADSEEHAAALVDSLPDDYEDLLQDTTKTMQAVEATTVGPVAITTFDASAADMPLKGLTVNIEPVQAEGTPSPENPLPISGWTGANVFDDPKYALKINWNQIRTDSAQTNTLDGITTTYDPQTHLFTITNNSRTTNFGTGSTQCVVSSVAPIPGHRYALLGEYHAGVAVAAVKGTTLRPTASVGSILTMSATTPNTGFRLRITSSYDFVSAHPVGDVYSFYLNIVDITQLLGEEAAATATYDQIAEMFPNDWYPYNAGEITCVSAVNGDPYRKISVNWQNEAGTVYGGTATYNGNGTWTIKSDWVYYSLTSLTRSSNHNFYKNTTSFNRPPKPSLYTTDGLICDRLPTISNPGASAAVDGCYTNGSSAIIVRTQEAYSTAADAIAGLGGVVNFAYKTNAVREFVVSTEELISTFLGTNNIWADAGDVTVTYGAYLETVKSYADQVGDSILSAIAPLETSYTASRAYTVGSFLFVGTKFYKVTAAIASGDIITPDTNVTQTTVAEQLMALANV